MLNDKGYCSRGPCQLYANALSVAFEFALILLTLSYTANFGMADVANMQIQKAVTAKRDGEMPSVKNFFAAVKQEKSLALARSWAEKVTKSKSNIKS